MAEHLITRIEKESERRKRYHIYVDEALLFSIHEDVLVKFHLHKGMSIVEEQIREIMEAEERNRTRQSALHYLSYRPRATGEVREHLRQKEYEAHHIDSVIEELQQWGYLDDQKYAHNWVDERRRRKGYGRERLRRELSQKGIAESLIEEAIQDTDEQEERQLATEVAKRRYLRMDQEPWPAIERRLGSYLLRRGFSSEIVFSVLHRLRAQHQEERER